MNARETCTDCGHSWPVIGLPRVEVLCEPCSRPKPWVDPVRYWQSRINLLRFASPTHSPEWWDSKTSLIDLRVALASAHEGRAS